MNYQELKRAKELTKSDSGKSANIEGIKIGDETTIERVEYKRLGRRNLEINEIWIRQHEICPNGVIGIEWSGDAGFGRYELILGDDGKLHAMTECMDIPTQKMFSRDVLNAILRDIVIDE